MAEMSQGSNSAEVMARRFNVGCVVALLPHDLRPRALAELTERDPGFFFMGHDHARVVTESAVTGGTALVRRALARVVHDAEPQRGLAALDDLEIDTALADNPCLTYQVECDLRRRRPALVASAAAYQLDHHRAALLSDDPELAAAALLDRREARHGSPIPPTVWATAWRTIRLHDGVERMRELLAALPTDRPLDEATLEIAEACAQPDPEPFLTSAEDRLTGTGALLRRLREVRTPQDQDLGRAILNEPYRIDWDLIAATVLGNPLPRIAARMLARHNTSASVTSIRGVTQPRASVPPRDYSRMPLNPGPLGEGDPATTLSTTAVGGDLTIFHVWDAIALGLIDAEIVVELARPAKIVASHAGQESAFHADAQEPGGGKAAFHSAVISHVARSMTAAAPVPGFWIQLSMLIRTFDGTLPELLDVAAQPAPPRCATGPAALGDS